MIFNKTLIFEQTVLHDVLDSIIFPVMYTFMELLKKKRGVLSHQTSEKQFFSKCFHKLGEIFLIIEPTYLNAVYFKNLFCIYMRVRVPFHKVSN